MCLLLSCRCSGEPNNTRILESFETENFPYRFLGVLLPSISYVTYRNENVFPEGKRKMLLLRCFVGTAGLMLSFYAFQNMQLGDR